MDNTALKYALASYLTKESFSTIIDVYKLVENILVELEDEGKVQIMEQYVRVPTKYLINI